MLLLSIVQVIYPYANKYGYPNVPYVHFMFISGPVDVAPDVVVIGALNKILLTRGLHNATMVETKMHHIDELRGAFDTILKAM